LNGSVIYLDNGATSWPKPPEVAEAMAEFLNTCAGSAGRAGHCHARQATQVVDDCRRLLSEKLNIRRPERLIFTSGCTDATNLAIHGVVDRVRGEGEKPHVVFTILEHNAVRRPLLEMTRQGVIDSTIVGCDAEGFIDPEEIVSATNERTRLVACMHASNALATVQPVAEIGRLLRERRPEALYLVDAAQTAGMLDIDVEAMGADLLAFTAHKSLLGPTGLGGLFMGPRAYDPDNGIDRVEPLRQGGTGSDSLSEANPHELPCRFEPGTPNTVALAGLRAALLHAPENGLAREHEHVQRLLDAILDLDMIRVLGPPGVERRTNGVSMVFRNMSSAEAGAILDESFSIAARAGLHCAPGAYEAMQAIPDGALRLSPGPYTTDDEIDVAIDALRQIAAS